MDDVQVYICSTDLSSKCQPLFSATCPWAILLSLASLGSRIWGGDLHIVVYWGCSLEHHLGSSDVYRVAQGVAELCCSPKRLSQSHRNLMILQICSKLGQGGSDFICQDLPTFGCRLPPGKRHNLEWKHIPLWQFPHWNSAMNHGSQFLRLLGKCISSRFTSPWWLEVVAPANTVTSSLASCYPGMRSLK